MDSYNKANLKMVIHTGIEHLKLVYGKDFLEQPEVRRALSQKIGMNAAEASAENIESTIIKNMNNISAQLMSMADKQIKAIFPLHGDIARETYLMAKTEDGIDAKKFFTLLKIEMSILIILNISSKIML